MDCQQTGQDDPRITPITLRTVACEMDSCLEVLKAMDFAFAKNPLRDMESQDHETRGRGKEFPLNPKD